MPGTVTYAVRKALVDGFRTYIQAQNGYSSVEGAYAWNPAFHEENRDRFWTSGGEPSDQETAGMKAGRRFRDETKTFDVLIRCDVPGGTPDQAASRAVAIGTFLEEWLADNKNGANLNVSGLIWIIVTSTAGPYELAYAEGAEAELTVTVEYSARLT